MVEFKDKPDSAEQLNRILHPVVKKWFFSRFESFSLPQLYGVLEIHSRNNILVSAPTGATKCVTPDTTLLVEVDGKTKLLSGEQLIELAKRRGKKVMDVDKTGELYSVDTLKSYSLSDGRVKKKKAMVYFEKCNSELYRLFTEYGREVCLSPEHPLLVEKPTGPEWVPARDVKVGDKIAVPKMVCLPEKEITLNYRKAIVNLGKKARVVLTYEDYFRLKRKTGNFTCFDSLTSRDFYCMKSLLQTSFSKLSKETGICMSSLFRIFNLTCKGGPEKKSLFKVFKRAKKVKFEKNRIIIKNKGNQTFSFTYPKVVDVKTVRWLAFVLAEGLIGDYENGTSLLVSQKSRKELLKEFFKTTKDVFGLGFKKKNEKDYAINSTLFCYFLNDLFDIKRGRGRYVPLPDWLLNAKQEIRANFLNVFLSLEAAIPATGREIKVYQSNKNKIEMLNYLLLSFGIFCSIKKEVRWATNTVNKVKRVYYGLSLQKIRDIKLFLKHISIDHPRRFLLERQIRKKVSGEHVMKHRFDYKKIASLSRFFGNYKLFKSELGEIYEAVRRTGFITENALLKLKRKVLKFRKETSINCLIKEIDKLLNSNICWLRVKRIKTESYKGTVMDLTVPDTHNFIGGYGGIYLHNTLTAFLSILNELIDSADRGVLEDRIYCVYISPLKALSQDIHINLVEPLKEMEHLAGKKLGIRVSVRTGDTTAYEKQLMLKHPPHILITTPESLAIMLSSSKFVEHLKHVEWCVVDEVHALAENKRGVHLLLSLERLQRLSSHITRVGLSATISPLEDVAEFLVGCESGKPRPCKVVDVQFIKEMDLKVLSPVPDLIDVEHGVMHDKLYELMDSLIQEHRTTLIFTNTRSATERVIDHLKDKFPKKYVNDAGSMIGAHHGSLSKDIRHRIEDSLRQGKLKAVVSSTSLELGIDIGYIDLVILLSSPKSVARAIQRIGRSGHRLKETAKGRLMVMDRDDLVECSVLLKSALEKRIDRIHIPSNCLDVLAQQVYGIAIADKIHIKDLFGLVKQSYCFRKLDYKDFTDVLDYLSGKHVSLEDRHIYAKIWVDEETGMIGRKGVMSRVIYMTNIGTIPDESFITVKVGNDTIGKIDEAFLERLKRSDVFTLGGDTYEFLFSRGMVAQVKSSVSRPPTIPSWVSEMLPLSFDLAMEIGKFRRLMEEKFNKNCSKAEILSFINEYLYVDSNSVESIYRYFNEQFLYAEIPQDKKLLIEVYNDGKRKYAVFHSLFGRRVNDCLSRAVALVISRSQHKDVEIGVNDNGFYLAFDSKVDVEGAVKLLKSEKLDLVMDAAIENSEILRRRFRHCAARALMILRQYKGRQQRVGRQQVSSMILMNAVKRVSNDFPILKEARREVLEDLMDIENTKKVLKLVEQGKVKVKRIDTLIPSPFAFNIVLQGRLDVLKMEDKVAFLRNMHRMVLAKIGKKHEIDI